MNFSLSLRRRLSVLAATLSLGTGLSLHAQSGLQITYSSNGPQTLSYNGIVLEDTNSYPSDSFHIWHMKSSAFDGTPYTNGQYGWGENNNGRKWNSDTHTMTYQYVWGSIAVAFVQAGDTLNMNVTETNNSNSGVLFDGAEIYPFTLHFPNDPAKFYGYNQYAITTTGPGVSAADFGSGIVTSVIPDESIALYGGWKSAGGSAYSPLMSATTPDGLAQFLPHNDVPVQPGASLSYTVSLRFTPEGTAADASDAYASFARTYPSQINWTDRRIIGTAYLASASSNQDDTQPGGFPTNPRRYFNDSSVDITSQSGLQAFQNRMLQQAFSNVANAQRMSAQGVITWDIEGEQYPHSTTYVCSPDQVARVSPEMESTILDSSSKYFGSRLDDAYFAILTGAGLRAGVCIRPQVFTPAANGTASQVTLGSNAAVLANLENKIRFANSRWGVTMFYVDSTVDVNGGTLDPAIFQQISTDFPAFLIVPEESTPRYYAYSAPFYSFIFHGDLGTSTDIYKVYPRAFGANLVNDVAAGTLASAEPQLIQAVQRGDILMGHADSYQDNDPTLVSIYQAAGVVTAPPVKTTPSLSWNAPASIAYGTALSGAQLDAAANVNGSFMYSPGFGAMLNAGTSTLTATFTPADTSTYNTASISTSLKVTQLTPAIKWSAPLAIVQGTALSGTQLNAVASVPGSYTYNPAAGVTPVAGTTTLNVTFTPTDTTNYTSASASVPLTVTAAVLQTPSVYWGNPASIVYGTALYGRQLSASASVPGSFVYTPALGTVLSAGTHALTVVFTPANQSAYSSVTRTVTLTVTKAQPQLSWQTPGAVVAGTALSSAQLNANASVAGTFRYTPGATTVVSAGSVTLSAAFTPNDSADYNSGSISVSLAVTALPASNINILSPVAGQTVSGHIVVTGDVRLFLDAAGSFLIVDGVWYADHRVTGGPFLYPFDTTRLSNGPHTLQIWGHDIGNNTTISPPVTVVVNN